MRRLRNNYSKMHFQHWFHGINLSFLFRTSEKKTQFLQYALKTIFHAIKTAVFFFRHPWLTFSNLQFALKSIISRLIFCLRKNKACSVFSSSEYPALVDLINEIIFKLSSCFLSAFHLL